MRRKHQSAVIAMNHDKGADTSCRPSPGCLIYALKLVVLIHILDSERIRESASEEMAGCRLQGFSVMHQRFNGVRILCSGKLLMLCLSSGYEWYRKRLLVAVFIYMKHLDRAFLCLFICCMDCVAFLP